MTIDERPSTLRAWIVAALLRGTRTSRLKTVIYLATHFVIPIALAYVTVVITIEQEQTAQYETEVQLLNQLTLAARFEAEENANDIRRWQHSLLNVAQPISDFVMERKPSRPDINPGYARLRTSALGALVQSSIAIRHMRPCVISTLSQVHSRMNEANEVHTTVDAALVEYTATYPQPLRESQLAAARLHAHIEQLLKIYEGLPDRLHLIADHDPWPCVVDNNWEKSGHGAKAAD